MLKRFVPLLRRRLLYFVPMLAGVILLSFFMLKAAPGDLVSAIAAESQGLPEQYIQHMREMYGLDQPLLTQLGRYVWGVVTLDLGFSVRYQEPVATLIASRFGATALLMLSSLILSVVIGTGLGILAARNASNTFGRIISSVSLVLYSVPQFWIGLMMIVLFAVKLRWLPLAGMETIGGSPNGHLLDLLAHLAMPAATLSLFFLAVCARVIRNSMLEVDGLDFVRTARAKGLPEGRVVFQHVFKNALLPLITIIGVQLGTLLGGAIVVETVFSWPGLGRLLYEAVTTRDLSVVLGVLIFSAVVVMIVNIITDLIYMRVDPRVTVS